MPDNEYWSRDQRFGMALPERELARMVGFCKRAKGKETGGILVGSYSEKHDCALVGSVSKAPRDSQAGPTWFRRGVSGLQRWLSKLWKSKTYYLGEWHFHPFAAPDPSGTDISEMVGVSKDDRCKCPEPVLVILGGNPAADWQLRAFVFPRGQARVELFPAPGDSPATPQS